MPGDWKGRIKGPHVLSLVLSSSSSTGISQINTSALNHTLISLDHACNIVSNTWARDMQQVSQQEEPNTRMCTFHLVTLIWMIPWREIACFLRRNTVLSVGFFLKVRGVTKFGLQFFGRTRMRQIVDERRGSLFIHFHEVIVLCNHAASDSTLHSDE